MNITDHPSGTKPKHKETNVFLPQYNRFHLLRNVDSKSETHIFARLTCSSVDRQDSLQLLNGTKAYSCNLANSDSCSMTGSSKLPSATLLYFLLSNPFTSTCVTLPDVVKSGKVSGTETGAETGSHPPSTTAALSSSSRIKLCLKLVDHRKLSLIITFNMNEIPCTPLLNSLHSSLLTTAFSLYSLGSNFVHHSLYQHANTEKDIDYITTINQVDKNVAQAVKKSVNVDRYAVSCKVLSIAGVVEKELVEENERKRKRKLLERRKQSDMRRRISQMKQQHVSQPVQKASLFNDMDIGNDDDDSDSDEDDNNKNKNNKNNNSDNKKNKEGDNKGKMIETGLKEKGQNEVEDGEKQDNISSTPLLSTNQKGKTDVSDEMSDDSSPSTSGKHRIRNPRQKSSIEPKKKQHVDDKSEASSLQKQDGKEISELKQEIEKGKTTLSREYSSPKDTKRPSQAKKKRRKLTRLV